MHDFESTFAEDGNIKTVVLISFHSFDEDQAVGFKGSGTLKHRVGALIGFDRKYRALAHDTALSNVEIADSLGDLYAVLHIIRVGFLFAGSHQA